MSFSKFNLSEVLVPDGTPTAAQFRFMAANNNHKARANAVRDLIDFACNELEVYRQSKQDKSEDDLTIEIVSNLKLLGVDAEHDPQQGGHCDILVKAPHMFVWIAEAKKHSSYGWLNDGFQQLTTRYSTGKQGQDEGEVLIYCKSADAKSMLEKWEAELKARNSNVSTSPDPNGNNLVFWSEHKHVVSGLNFSTRHKVVALHFDPKK